jgi:hypothetical protein
LRLAGGGCAIPSSATAVVGTVTIFGAGVGSVLLWPDDERSRLELYFHGEEPRSGLVILPLSPGRTITASLAGSGYAHLTLEVSGYFAAGSRGEGSG